MELLFWTAIGLCGYAVVGYPLCILLFRLVPRRPLESDATERSVAMVIPVHNGEHEIEAKLINSLEQAYPSERLDIIVVSDGSTDATEREVRKFGDVTCIALAERVGKVAAQNAVLDRLDADVVIFTDVGIRMEPDAVRNVVARFADRRVGVVSCRDEIEDDEAHASSESVYIGYDMFVRQLMQGTGSLIGVTGGFYAVRRTLLSSPWPAHFAPDFYAALLAIRHRLVAIEDVETRARYGVVRANADEYVRKVRTVTRGMHTLFGNADLLNPLKYPVTAWKLISHKLLRWSMPLLAIIAFASNLSLVVAGAGLLYTIALLAQTFFWAVGLLARVFDVQRQPLRTASQVWMLNAALLRAWMNLVRGKSFVTWTPTRRV